MLHGVLSANSKIHERFLRSRIFETFESSSDNQIFVSWFWIGFSICGFPVPVDRGVALVVQPSLPIIGPDLACIPYLNLVPIAKHKMENPFARENPIDFGGNDRVESHETGGEARKTLLWSLNREWAVCIRIRVTPLTPWRSHVRFRFCSNFFLFLSLLFYFLRSDDTEVQAWAR